MQDVLKLHPLTPVAVWHGAIPKGVERVYIPTCDDDGEVVGWHLERVVEKIIHNPEGCPDCITLKTEPLM